MLDISLSPVEIQAFSFAFLFFVTTLAAFFILTTSPRDRIARTFAVLALFGGLINLFALFYHVTDDLELARGVRVVSQFFTIPFLCYMVMLGLLSYEKHLPAVRTLRIVGYGLCAAALLLAPLFMSDLFGTAYVIGALTDLPSVQLSPEPGPYLMFLIAAFALAASYFGYLMLRLWTRGTTRDARVMGMLMFVSAFLPTVARAASWAPWYGIGGVGYASLFISLAAGPLFAFGTAYAIVRHKLFNIRLIAAELLIFGLWSFVFLRALLAHSVRDALPDLTLLLATIILGIFLIRSVLKEVKQREELQVATSELTALNERLEERVKERTQELDRSKSHVEQVIENLTAGLIEFTSDYRIIRINRAAEVLLGVRREEVVGKRFDRRDVSPAVASLYPVLFPETAEGYAKPLEQPEGARLEEATITSPERRDLQLTTAPIPTLEGGKKGLPAQAGFITLIRDISREKQIDRSKSEFLTIAAHQLRTPLTAIRWSLKLFLDGGAGRVSRSQREILENEDRASGNMLKIINDLLNAVHIEEGRFGFRFEDGDLPRLVREVGLQFQAIARSKDIALTLNVPEQFSPVRIDAEKMRMVIQNLIDNALKYTLQGGSVVLSLSAMDGMARLSVADTGIGIGASDRPRLFTKFFRTKRATEMFTDGSGLGLFIVKNIIDGHGGTIAIASGEGLGTTVTIDLPLWRTEGGLRKTEKHDQ